MGKKRQLEKGETKKVVSEQAPTTGAQQTDLPSEKAVKPKAATQKHQEDEKATTLKEPQEVDKKAKPATRKIVLHKESAVGDGNCAFNAWVINFYRNLDYFIQLTQNFEVRAKAPGLVNLLFLWNANASPNLRFQSNPTQNKLNSEDLENFLSFLKSESKKGSQHMQLMLAPLFRVIAMDQMQQDEAFRANTKNVFEKALHDMLRQVALTDPGVVQKFEEHKVVSFNARVQFVKHDLVFQNFKDRFESYRQRTATGYDYNRDNVKTPEDIFFFSIMFIEEAANSFMNDNAVQEFKTNLYHSLKLSIETNQAQPILTLLKDTIDATKDRVPVAFKDKLQSAYGYLNAKNFDEQNRVLFHKERASRGKKTILDFENLGLIDQEQLLAYFNVAEQTVENALSHSMEQDEELNSLFQTIFENPGKFFLSSWEEKLHECNGHELTSLDDWNQLTAQEKAGWISVASGLIEVRWEQIKLQFQNDLSGVFFGERDSTFNRPQINQKLSSIISNANDQIIFQASQMVDEYLELLANQADEDAIKNNRIHQLLQIKDVMQHVETNLELLLQQSVYAAEKQEYKALIGDYFIVLRQMFREKQSEERHPAEEFLMSQAVQDDIDLFLENTSNKYLNSVMTASNQGVTQKIRAHKQLIANFLNRRPIANITEQTMATEVKLPLKRVLLDIVAERLKQELLDKYQTLESQSPPPDDNVTVFYQAEQELKKFWVEQGAKVYFDGLKTPALGGGDSRQWGSEVELKVLSDLFGTNLHMLNSAAFKYPGRELTFYFENPGMHFYALYEKTETELQQAKSMANPVNHAPHVNTPQRKPAKKSASPSSVHFSNIYNRAEDIDYSKRFTASFVGTLLMSVVSLVLWLNVPAYPFIAVTFFGLSVVGLGLSVYYGFKEYKRDQQSSHKSLHSDNFFANREVVEETDKLELTKQYVAANQENISSKPESRRQGPEAQMKFDDTPPVVSDLSLV